MTVTQLSDGTWVVFFNGVCQAHHLNLCQVYDRFPGPKTFTLISAREYLNLD